ncbi:gamma carbonic anhydrase family protein [Aquabacterium sp. OR-4]|uniref:gamma carbonic anhydrase family protein n=1 Tax=Aquabacterium sp. OR-4 TaxID=2978127 RepID=UPI0021B182F1|nr:gamma carbonic anhydrase family protein [Aquabacterium sp. OR-4]MDT7836200.1 gamma carbonic anhydrase family protein [Aquabacterium sp. OR-4]
MAIYQLGERRPEIHPDAWVADSAQVIGHVHLAEHASVWYGAIVRADNDHIRIGRNSNVQDGSVLHIDTGMPLQIGDDVTIGHQVMLHGCSIGDGTLVGIQSVILNGARIGRNSIVGAGALVTEGKEFPDGVLIVGSPAKVVRELTPEQVARVQMSARHYVAQARLHREQLLRIDR